MNSLNFNEEILALPNKLFQNRYVLLFDLTSLQDAGENVGYPELSGDIIRWEIFFELLLGCVTELFVIGVRMSNVKINQFGTVVKYIWRLLR